jgi:hypothetical protein
MEESPIKHTESTETLSDPLKHISEMNRLPFTEEKRNLEVHQPNATAGVKPSVSIPTTERGVKIKSDLFTRLVKT